MDSHKAIGNAETFVTKAIGNAETFVKDTSKVLVNIIIFVQIIREVAFWWSCYTYHYFFLPWGFYSTLFF